MRSRDRGASWEEVGGIDLTKQIDRDELEIMGVPGTDPMMSIHDGTSTFGNITTLAESPLERGVVYVGTDDGNLQVTRDDGATWTNVADRIGGLPERTYVSRVEPSAHIAGRVYATFDGHRNGDYAPYVYVSEDYGRSWSAIADGLPDGWSVNVITEHHRTPRLLFLGNEIGVYVSVDRGERWVRLKNNFPTVPVDDILVHPRDNDLLVGTHGRSMWILADVSPLEHLSSEMLAQPGRVLPTARESIMWAQRGDWPFYGATYSASNPPRGALIRYYLRDEIEELSLEISDAGGAHVRTLEAPGKPGINEIVWDWRHDPPHKAGGGNGRGGGGGRGRGRAPQGPVVLPGTYAVTMRVDGDPYSATVDVAADPRRPMTAGARRASQSALLSLHVLAVPINEASQAVERLDELLDDAEALVDAADAPESLRDELSAAREELDAIDDELGIARQNAGVAGAVQGSSTLPTEDQLWQIDRAWEVMPGVVERLNVLIRTRIPALHGRLYTEEARPSLGEPIEMPARPPG